MKNLNIHAIYLYVYYTIMFMCILCVYYDLYVYTVNSVWPDLARFRHFG